MQKDDPVVFALIGFGNDVGRPAHLEFDAFKPVFLPLFYKQFARGVRQAVGDVSILPQGAAPFDFLLHRDYDPQCGASTMKVLESVREQVAVLHPPAWQRFPHAFTHIFSGGYAAGYYSYLWAELLSADAFSAFEERGETGASAIDPQLGTRFRAEVLSVGASRPVLESFTAFRGRAPQPAALLRSYGLAA